MYALTVDSAKNIAIVVVIALVLLAVLAAKLVANVTKKAILLLAFGALALGVWSQRQTLSSCAESVKSNGGLAETKCTFIGKTVTIPGVVPAP